MVIKGKVIKGEGIASGLGYPTANLNVDVEKTGFSSGIYAGVVVLDGKEYRSAIIINREIKKIEAHLLEYLGDNFYNLSLKVEMLGKVSDIEKLKGEELRSKIKKDIKKIKKVFNI